jgi:hypothetical protein
MKSEESSCLHSAGVEVAGSSTEDLTKIINEGGTHWKETPSRIFTIGRNQYLTSKCPRTGRLFC